MGYADPHRAALEDNPEHAEKLTLSVALSAFFLGTSLTGPIVFGFLFVSTILVQLTHKIGGENNSFWIPSGWSAAAGVVSCIAGRLSDIFGRRDILLFGQFLTIAGGIVAATANTMNQLIAGEVMLGASIGAVAVAYAGISEILPNKYRGIGLAWTELNLAVWAVPATLLANLMVTNASWRIMYYIAIGYGTFSLVGTACVYFPPKNPRADGKTKWQQCKELDFMAIFLFVAGLVVFLYGLNSGGTTYPWVSVGTLVPLVLGLTTLLAAFAYDFTVADDPIFPWYLFKAFRRYSALLVLIFIASMVFYAAAALNAQTILFLHSADPVKIGIYSLPSGFAQLVGGAILPAFVHRIKHVHYQIAFGLFMQTLFFGLAALITPTNLNWLMAVQFLAMFPFGWVTLNCYTTASLNIPQRDLGVAIGLIGSFRSIGGSIGSVLFSSIFNQVAAKQVASRIAVTAAKAGITPNMIPALIGAVEGTIVGVPGLDAKFPNVPASVFSDCVSAARHGYAYGLRITWLSSIPFGIVAVVCGLCVLDPSKYFTNHVEIHLEKEIGRGESSARDKEIHEEKAMGVTGSA
ncbi:hypothetical protein VE01_05147 [Pseudogymnoascus verrucosus]|uniref:Major facilitator superfamily (MFS) profile domain-containing protein n=1 Tax=Pseudogymnoascus verrucosus TaxID=342668 RepID=A0A1B8GI22_9PEZI|nr:uncharacterized protein VE01_05147 [Pseudogymnoascus verrucosus]OBT95445.2 hypothetical protein VE01_05147 [Pseudogymnoascus verrucosus]